MKKIFLLLLVLISVQSFGQMKKKYAENLNTNGTIDSFYVWTPVSHDSIFNYANDEFVERTLEYYVRNNLPLPAGFSLFHLDADGVYRNFTQRSNAALSVDYPNVINKPSAVTNLSGNNSGDNATNTQYSGLQTALNNKTTYYTGTDAGANDSYVVTLSPVPPSLTAGMIVIFRANTANTTGCTINVNGLGVVNILKRVSTTPATGDILSQMWCMLVYNGTNFILLNPVVN